MRYAVINNDGLVINVIDWDGKAKWSPPSGCYVIQDDHCDINDFYNRFTKKFTKPIIISADPS